MDTIDPGHTEILDYAEYILIDESKSGIDAFHKLEDGVNLIRDTCDSFIDNTFTCTETLHVENIADDHRERMTLDLYPNPATEMIYIKLKLGFRGSLVETDISGKSIEKQELSKQDSYILDVNDYPIGCYQIVLISNTDQVIYQRFIKI